MSKTDPNKSDIAVDKMIDDAPVVLVDSHGIKFILNKYERPRRYALVRRSCDDDVFAAYSIILKPGDIVFDIGAHIGRYSVFPSRIIGDNGHVYAFEPVKDNYWQLRTTLSLNRCENVTAINKAITDSNGNVEINLFGIEYSSWSSFANLEMIDPYGNKITAQRTEIVTCETIDDYCTKNDISIINFMKIDVEGCELNVLRGANNLLKNHKIGTICFEISEAPLRASGASAKQIVDLLISNGYSIYAISGPPYKFSGPITDVDCFHGNYYASIYDLAKY